MSPSNTLPDDPAAELAVAWDLPTDAHEDLRWALRAASRARELGQPGNDLLAWLGDRVRNLAMAEIAWSRHATSLSECEALYKPFDSRDAGARFAKELGIDLLVEVGGPESGVRGAVGSRGATAPATLDATFEAVIAVIFIHRGYGAARDFVWRVVKGR